MLKSAEICLYFATVAWHVNKCLAEPKDNGRSVCLLEDPPNQCGKFCLTALKPMINHIDRHQDEWMSACGATKANETQGKLEHIKSQLLSLQSGQSNVQEALHKVCGSLETSWEKLNPEDFKARLERIESQNTAQMELLQGVKTSMESSKQAVPPDFVKVGSRYFYIENKAAQNWFSAGHTCRSMGGYLASPRKEELEAFNLKNGVIYWLGISDLSEGGRFISSCNGKPASFLKWRPNEPNNIRNSQHCVAYDNSGMDDDDCKNIHDFICQAGEEN